MSEIRIELYEDIFEQLNTSGIISDENGVVVSVNAAYVTLSGYAKEEVLGKHMEDLLEGFNRQHKRWEKDAIIKKKDGTRLSQWLFANVVKESSSGGLFHVWLMTDFQICGLDPLTKLPNRFLLHQKLNDLILKSQEDSSLFAVLFIDLDRFKFINDTLGHAAGDQLLLEAAVRIKDAIGDTSMIARMGGDEFVCVLRELKDENEAELRTKEIIKAFTIPFSLKEIEIYISTSIGISVYPYDGDEADLLISNADSAMYRAKKKGRNRYEYSKVDLNASGFETLLIENNLRKAIDRDELLLYFQPQVQLKTNQILSVEALLRWNHPDLGMISPGEFIPIAEETGLIIPIGDWVLRTACLKMREWQDAGYPPVRVAVNLSAGQFLQNDLVNKIKTVLAESSLDPSFLELEITENMVMHDVHSAINVLRELKEVGVQISIDDFGTGYSSLNYLKEFPVDTLKIDRSFIQDIDSNPDSGALTKAITTLAHDLNLKVIAEGVETEKQLFMVRQHACDAVQGFYYSKPLSYEHIVHFLNDYQQAKVRHA